MNASHDKFSDRYLAIALRSLFCMGSNGLTKYTGLIIAECVYFLRRPKRAAVSNPPLVALTNFRTFTGKATLPEPWKVAAHVCYASKPKSLDRLGANVRDGFFNRIRRENQL